MASFRVYRSTIRVRANRGRTAMLLRFRMIMTGTLSRLALGTVLSKVSMSLAVSGAPSSRSSGILDIRLVRLALYAAVSSPAPLRFVGSRTLLRLMRLGQPLVNDRVTSRMNTPRDASAGPSVIVLRMFRTGGAKLGVRTMLLLTLRLGVQSGVSRRVDTVVLLFRDPLQTFNLEVPTVTPLAAVDVGSIVCTELRTLCVLRGFIKQDDGFGVFTLEQLSVMIVYFRWIRGLTRGIYVSQLGARGASGARSTLYTRLTFAALRVKLMRGKLFLGEAALGVVNSVAIGTVPFRRLADRHTTWHTRIFGGVLGTCRVPINALGLLGRYDRIPQKLTSLGATGALTELVAVLLIMHVGVLINDAVGVAMNNVVLLTMVVVRALTNVVA